jgi:hypothetical protein
MKDPLGRSPVLQRGLEDTLDTGRPALAASRANVGILRRHCDGYSRTFDLGQLFVYELVLIGPVTPIVEMLWRD